MIVKRLRLKNGWSQDQLATLSGLSLRTIQRVEAGHPASMETINSLSSVFATDITKFTEEMNVIDKSLESWKNAPIWVRMGVWGIRSRKVALRWEFGAAVIGAVGIIGIIAAKFHPQFLTLSALSAFWCAAYWNAASIRWIDNAKLWL